MLENLLETIDPGLESWGVYLIAACKHLQKKNYYHILYELQQFMKVRVEISSYNISIAKFTENFTQKMWYLANLL